MSDRVTDVEDETVRWREFLSEATGRLERSGVESPGVDARRIVERAAGVEPSEFHEVLEAPATQGGVARFDRMVSRREAGEPLQYVVGHWGFRTLDLYVDRRVLIPRPETEVVAGLAIDEANARRAGGQVLVADLGTGSGAIGLSIAVECPAAQVHVTERSSDAAVVARSNLAGIGRAATRVALHEGDWFDALPCGLRGSFDVVVANPPYVADDERLPPVIAAWEPAEALRAGPTGTEDIVHLLDEVGGWLTPGGVFIVELAPHQAQPMAERARTLGFDTSVRSDLAGRERALVARR